MSEISNPSTELNPSTLSELPEQEGITAETTPLDIVPKSIEKAEDSTVEIIPDKAAEVSPTINLEKNPEKSLEKTSKPKPVILKVSSAPDRPIAHELGQETETQTGPEIKPEAISEPSVQQAIASEKRSDLDPKTEDQPIKSKPVIVRVAPTPIAVVPAKNMIVTGDTEAPKSVKVKLEPPASKPKPPESNPKVIEQPTRPKPVILSVTPAPAPASLLEVIAETIAPEVKVEPKAPKAEKAAVPERLATPKSFSMDDFAKALQAQSFQFVEGQVISGRVAEHDTRGAYIDIGGKSPGFLPLDEAVLGGAASLEEALPVNTVRDFVIIREADADGAVTLSVKSFLMKQAWNNLRQFQSKNQSFNCKILDSNTGGLVVSAQGWRGFIPRSHLNTQVSDIEQIRGTTLPVVVLELDEERSKIVLSNRLAVKSSALGQLQKGQLVSGTVSSIRPFGLFIELGGMSGLLHVKEISQKYIGNVESVFAIGEQIKAVVIDVDESRQRIALSTKILELHSGEILEHPTEVFAEAEQRLEKNISKLWES
jgi:small subunit ribosomal protein S1